MAHFEWQAEYSVGIASIDLQHKRLVNLINDLFDAMQSGKGSQALGSVFDGLVNYTKTHFATEEKLLRDNGYPNLDGQLKSHGEFTHKIEEMQAQFKSGKMTSSLAVSNFLKDWLINHILGLDKQYSDFLNGCGVK